jgi:enoyl-[acyl-carrier protein] reductase II
MSIEKTPFDTVYTDRFDGLPARIMDSKGARWLMHKRLNPFSALLLSRQIAKLLGFPWLKLAVGILLMGPKKSMQMARMATGFKAFEVGTMNGDNVKGILPLGQVTGIIHDTPTVKKAIERIIDEAVNTEKRISKMI